MKCYYCGKEYDQDQERVEYNKKHPKGLSYDDLGLHARQECLVCREERLGRFAKELSARIV